MPRKHLSTLVFIGVFIGLSLLTAAYTAPHPVVIFVVDNFEPNSNHGLSVANLVRRWSFGQCQIVPKNIGQKNILNLDLYLQALQQIEIYARHHPHTRVIVNLSLGGSHPVAAAMIAALYRRQAVIVAAAGNDGKEVTFYPAAFAETIAVASVSFSGKKLRHSNYGRHITLAVEEGEIVAANSPHLFYITAPGGTSLSTPKVAGVIAHILSQNRLSRQELEQLLQRHCRRLPANSQLGWGKLHLNGLLWDASTLYRLFFCLWLAAAVILLLLVIASAGYLKGPGALIILPPLALVLNDFTNVLFDLTPFYSSVSGRTVYSFFLAAALAFSIRLATAGIKQKKI